MSNNSSLRFDGLLPYQRKSFEDFYEAFVTKNVAVNASDLGTGKTYVTSNLLAHFRESPQLIICPLSVVPTWKKVLKLFGAEADVVNYEKARMEKFGYGAWSYFDRGEKTYKRWTWGSEVDTICWDEVHRCGGDLTENSLLLRAAKRQGKRILMLSGTLAESPLKLKAIGYALDLYGPGQVSKDFRSFLFTNGCVPTPFGIKFTGRGFPGINPEERQKSVMSRIRGWIFPEYGTRLTVEDIGAEFPESQISAELYQTADDGREINRLYSELAAEVERWRNKSATDRNPEHPLTKRLRERELIELLKVGIFEDLATDALAEGHSVVIFVSFIPTLRALAERFPEAEIFYGDCSDRERQSALANFQSGDSNTILVQIDCGGTGVDLHDLVGGHPRYVLLSPGYSAVNLRQALRRVQRIGAKTKSIQRVVCVAGTVEEDVAKAIQRKSGNLDALNDEDLTPENLRTA